MNDNKEKKQIKLWHLKYSAFFWLFFIFIMNYINSNDDSTGLGFAFIILYPLSISLIIIQLLSLFISSSSLIKFVYKKIFKDEKPNKIIIIFDIFNIVVTLGVTFVLLSNL